MKSKTLLLLTLTTLAAGMGAWIYFYEIQGEEARQREEDLEERILTAERDQIVGMTVVNSHGTFRFDKKGEEWLMSEPMATEADSMRMDDLLSAATTMKSVRRMTSTPEQLESFGLTSPRMSLAVQTGTEQQVVEVGAETPFGGQFYARLKGKEEVVVVAYDLGSRLDHDVNGFRNKKITNVPVAELSWLRAQRADGSTFTAEKKADLWYAAAATPPFRLKARELEDLLYAVKDLTALSFVDPGAPPPPLDPPSLVLEYRRKKVGEEDPATTRLVFGPPSGEGEGATMAVRLEGKDQLWTVSADFAQRFARTEQDLRDKAPFAFDRWETDKVEVAVGGTKYVATRKDFDWTVEPKATAFTGDEVTQVMDLIMVAEAVQIVDTPQPDLALYGLGAPALALSFTKGSEAPRTFLLGEGAEGATWVKVEGEASVYQMAPSLLRDVSKIFEDPPAKEAGTPAPQP